MHDQFEQLLASEVATIEAFLTCFEGATTAQAGLSPSRGALWIQGFPLPAHYKPDSICLLLDVSHFPIEPPKGMYLLTNATNRTLVEQLKKRFNVFQNLAFHGAQGVEGYEWLCFGYLDGWRYNIRQPNKGDNIAKMLISFWRMLEEKK
ncbi:hypothetical protein J4G57_17925 [Aeromonas caviae]|uniref:hypothetical protein n=1 Tax=Aeromonas caviae TaxID=648 RepID=UPI001BD3ECED|nr:hypothetical protein [Aeromonas caviae]MBS4709740.1 hypothetical protein [Aeromonas caviae]MDX7710648.1 hypothetical protein [Aeromonas caviae]MDX7717470.1 hypothetical protein [Aeromonas caviae]MDX7860008.1 hypothetical protein [Aeromonas caviae]